MTKWLGQVTVHLPEWSKVNMYLVLIVSTRHFLDSVRQKSLQQFFGVVRLLSYFYVYFCWDITFSSCPWSEAQKLTPLSWLLLAQQDDTDVYIQRAFRWRGPLLITMKAPSTCTAFEFSVELPHLVSIAQRQWTGRSQCMQSSVYGNGPSNICILEMWLLLSSGAASPNMEAYTTIAPRSGE